MMPKEQDSSDDQIAAVLCIRLTTADGEPGMIHDTGVDMVHEAVVDVIARHKGRLVAAEPNLFVIVRDSFVALASAIEIQQDMAARNAAVPEARRAAVAIGIDVGKVDTSAQHLSGWTVDIAARLAEMAGKEEVFVSQFARNQAIGRSKFKFEDRGSTTITAEAPPFTIHRLLFDPRPPDFVPRVRGAPFRQRLWTAMLLAAGVAALYAVSYMQGIGAD